MKSTLSRKLRRGTLLLTVTIVLVSLCFAAQAAVQGGIRVDEEALGTVAAALRSASQAAAALAALPAPETALPSMEALRAARAQAQDGIAPLGSSTFGSTVYSQDLRDALSQAHAAVGVSWSAAAERMHAAGVQLSAGDQGRSPYMDLLPGFLAETDRQIAGATRLEAQVSATRDAASRAFEILFAFIAGVGTAIGLAYSLVTIYGLRRDLRRVSAHGRRLAEGDFEPAEEVRRQDELGEISAQLAALHGLQRLLADVQGTSERLGPESSRLSSGIARASASTRNEGKALEETVRRFASVVQSIRKVTEQAASSGEAARIGIKTVDRSLQSIGRGIEQARYLQERTSRIEEVVSLLGDVADQTELLSLNAAIEAARAGESGRGFTVVAQQVRKLSDRSAGAASEIADLTELVLDGVRRVSTESQSSLETITQLQKDLAALFQSVQSISELSGGAAATLAKADSSVAATLELASEASRRIEEAGGTAGTVQEIASQLAQLVSRLRAGRAAPRPTPVPSTSLPEESQPAADLNQAEAPPDLAAAEEPVEAPATEHGEEPAEVVELEIPKE